MRQLLLSAICVFVYCTAMADVAPLPVRFHVPTGLAMTVGRFAQFDKATIEYPTATKSERTDIEGRVWEFWLGSDVRPIADPAIMASRVASALEHDGWSILRHDSVLVAREGDTWVTGYGNSGSFKVKLIERAPLPRAITLTPPSAIVENAPDDRDFPWFSRFPGAKLKATQHGDRPIDITAPGAKETSFSGPSVTKTYDAPNDVSSYEFVTTYRRALAASGWTIVREGIGGDGFVLAHYVRSGRDLWIYARIAGTGQLVRAADTGADTDASNLKRAIESAGHVAVYGIYFDSDSATPKAESAATLQHILELLTGSPAMRLDIQGHTDDSGSAPHNQQLSEERAASVRSWLVSHGVLASRLVSHGYGATRPIADNKTPEGKSKNRRVELEAVH